MNDLSSSRRLAGARLRGACVGPVEDLEENLPLDWWRNLFGATYLMTDGDVVENVANTRADVDLLIVATGITPASRILDVCCGQGRHTLELRRRGYARVSGLDQSRYMVRLARSRARAEGLKLKFIEGDLRSAALGEGKLDCAALLGNSFGYFDDARDDELVLTSLRRALREGGVVALDLTDGDFMARNFEPRSWEWIDETHFACRERALSRDRERLICRELVVHTRRGVIADQTYAERLYSADRIEALLHGCGFEAITFHHSADTESSRGQDLGMMGRRVFLTGIAGGGREPRAYKKSRDVVVVLGDPRLPDSSRNSGGFSAEDHGFVEVLKTALKGLPGYRFEYLDDHSRLVSDLMNRPRRPDFVLNLCDEGLRNIRTDELHIPALLDALQIPYSGAAPAGLVTCANKALARAVAESLGVPVPEERLLAPSAAAIPEPARYPVLVKPCITDGSLGIIPRSFARDSSELVRAVAAVRAKVPGEPVLIQEFLPGGEWSVSVIGNPGGTVFRALPILEVDYSGLAAEHVAFLAHEGKWDINSPYYKGIVYRQATLDAAATDRLQELALAVFAGLHCRDYARIDFRADAAGTPRLIDVNPNPGWSHDCELVTMASWEGLEYRDLLALILAAAFERVEREGASS